jgi:cytochrome bd ubiquinol oxidase subunit I
MRDGVAHATDWWAIIFNPSMPYRLTHMLLASALTCAFLMAGVSAWQYLQGDRRRGVTNALKTGIVLAAIAIPTQILVGDLHGINTLKHQPAKVAAIEANWETRPNVPLVLFGIPDEKARTNHFEIAIPSGASVILKHDPAGVVPGLDDFKGAHPPVAPVFWAFRIMVGVGMLMLLVSWWAGWQLWRTKAISDLTMKALVVMTFSGWVATIAGWYVTEIGRQPWLISGVLRTADAASAVPAAMIGTTLLAYLATYVILTAAYIRALYYLADNAKAPVVQGTPSGGRLQPAE